MSELISRADLHYFEQHDLWKPPVMEQVAVADDIIALIPEDVQTILDAGCGNGVVTNRLIDRWDVFGCDLSHNALRQVRARSLVADLAAVPFKDNSFDLVLASDVIEHLPNGIYNQSLEELVRVARRYILIAVPHEEMLEAAQVICPKCGNRYHAHFHQRTYSIKNVMNLFEGKFGVRQIQFSGGRWLYRDPSLLESRNMLTGLDYAFENAVCPECGSSRGYVSQATEILKVGRRFDALQAMLSSEGLLPIPHYSELLVLFERGFHSEITSTILDTDYTIQLSDVIDVQKLPCFPDPITYPKCEIQIDSNDDVLIVVLPRSVHTLSIARGTLSSIDVFDYVRQSYRSSESLESKSLALPRVPYGPHGCIVKITDASQDLVLICHHGKSYSREDIVTLCFGDDPLTLLQLRQFEDMGHLVNELGEKREWLERELRVREDTMAELESSAKNINELANRLEEQRSSLTEQINNLQQENELKALRFADASRLIDQLTLQLNELGGKRKWLEQQLQAREDTMAELESSANNANELANQLEEQRNSFAKQINNLQQENELKALRFADASRLIDQLTLEHNAIKISCCSFSGYVADDRFPKAVLVLSHMYPRDYHPAGGIFVHEQVKALRASGIDVRVLSGEPYWINTLNPWHILKCVKKWFRVGNYNWDMFDNVPLIRFPYIVSSRFLPFQTHAYTYSLGVTRCVSKLEQPFNFQLVHAHTAYTDGSAGACLATKYRVPLVITEHTGPFKVLTRTPYLKLKTQLAMNSAHRLISVSKALLRDIESQISLTHPKRMCVVPNVVNTDFFCAVPRKIDKKISVLWVGHFVPVKRVDILLHAFALAVESEPRLYLRLVGSGELEGKLRQLVVTLKLENHVAFAGISDRVGLVAHYANCDFLVITSETETFGVVAIEAMSCGRPVLTTDCGGPAEIINHDSLGMVVNKSVESIASGLKDMARMINQYDHSLIRRVAEIRFSNKTICSKLIQIYIEMLS